MRWERWEVSCSMLNRSVPEPERDPVESMVAVALVIQDAAVSDNTTTRRQDPSGSPVGKAFPARQTGIPADSDRAG